MRGSGIQWDDDVVRPQAFLVAISQYIPYPRLKRFLSPAHVVLHVVFVSLPHIQRINTNHENEYRSVTRPDARGVTYAIHKNGLYSTSRLVRVLRMSPYNYQDIRPH